MTDRYTLELQATRAWEKLMSDGLDVRRLYDAARIPLPERLVRLLSEDANGASRPEPKVIVPAPAAPPRPTQWQSDWIWLPIAQVTPAGLVRGVLRVSTVPMGPKEIIAAISEMGRDLNRGSVANIGTRLDESGEIAREDGLWRALTPEKFPVLHDGHAWGPPDAFEKYEIAAHRRMGIVHLLNAQPDGMQIVQIVRTLQQCDWLRAPISKDLMKEDLRDLQKDGLVYRVGNSGKWRARTTA